MNKEEIKKLAYNMLPIHIEKKDAGGAEIDVNEYERQFLILGLEKGIELASQYKAEDKGIPQEIRDEMDYDMEDSGMAQGEIESCLNHWSNKYTIRKSSKNI